MYSNPYYLIGDVTTAVVREAGGEAADGEGAGGGSAGGDWSAGGEARTELPRRTTTGGVALGGEVAVEGGAGRKTPLGGGEAQGVVLGGAVAVRRSRLGGDKVERGRTYLSSIFQLHA